MLTFPRRVLLFRFSPNRPIIYLNSYGQESKFEENASGIPKGRIRHGGWIIKSSLPPFTPIM